MKRGKAWGLKRHVWPTVPFNTTTSYANIAGLDDLDVEDIDKFVFYIRIGDAASVTNVTIEANEVPDAPAADWMACLGYPQQISTVTAQHRANFNCEYHKRIRVRVQSDALCVCTVVSVAWAGWSPWVETKE